MDHFEKRRQLMDDYIMGQLTEKDSIDFENELQSNEQFAADFELHKNMVAGIKALGNRELKNELKIIHQQVTKPTTRVRPIWYRYVAVASILVLIAAGIWVVNQNNSNRDLFLEYYAPYKISLTVRGEPNAALMKSAEDAYLNGDFKTAAFEIENILKENYNSQLVLAAGIAYLEMDLYEQAIQKFNLLIDNNDEFLKDQAVWYLAMTMLRCNKRKEAGQYLEILAADKNADKHRDASVLLENLD
ncbi:MAG: hypothetical protein AAFZ15_08315 [Bacteroidota bacterium]